ncbi:MAG: hypothetical protein KGH49_01770 [Candidatus Micrarchaeota archaeon]|nr:hypothetical protein [Candidatus Micrarchaeota archaeon]
MSLQVFRSPDGRYRTEPYFSNEVRAFAISEKTANGVLVSEFTEEGELLDQIYKKSNDPMVEIANHVKHIASELTIRSVESYSGVEVRAKCDGCNGKSIKREMDLLAPPTILKIPVVPLFVCTNCKKKFYSMTPTYLRKLVARNTEMFEKNELEMRNAGEQAFIDEVQEYMVRVFASKKLTRIKVDK